ncbi:MAG: ATP-binding cassette domain-containing protein [Bacteroidales bacterium]|nr:ATP-binding cassette domain-containing protein [Bacteroidales bacterium]
MTYNDELIPVIEVKDLRKKFGNFTAVDGITLNVYRGEVFGFLGPNGAGKTTSINMMCGLLKPTDGQVIILGKNIGDSNFINVISKIGVCPQNIIIWAKLTCLEQLEFMGTMYGLSVKVARNRGKELLENLGLTEKMNKLAQTLSGGMQRRLNICLALVHDPEIVVFDEPEAGLDPQSKIMVRDFIKSVAKEKTVILTTHNMDEAERLADRIAIIDKGKLLLIDSPEELKKTIGEGDVLEIEIIDYEKNNIDLAYNELKKVSENVNVADNLMIIKSKNLIEKVADIVIILKQNNIKISEMRLRENTLEDVFIYLTGRKLRE